MKKQAITEVREALEKAVADLEKAIEKANLMFPNDRSYARNLETKLPDIKRYLYIVRSDEKYLTQPKFTKIFEAI